MIPSAHSPRLRHAVNGESSWLGLRRPWLAERARAGRLHAGRSRAGFKHDPGARASAPSVTRRTTRFDLITNVRGP
jgi:hypothetical protein